MRQATASSTPASPPPGIPASQEFGGEASDPRPDAAQLGKDRSAIEALLRRPAAT